GGGRGGDGIGIREVGRDGIQPWFDQLSRTVELVLRLLGRDAVEQGVVVGVRSHDDEAGRLRVTQRPLRRRRAVTRERAALLDEGGGDVERDRQAVALEAGQGGGDEIGRAVVERDADGVGGVGRAGRRDGVEATVRG